ncbi:MAG: YbaB/EbfC family nucleoid-associated protein [Alphaproteobacteria bacterium]
MIDMQKMMQQAQQMQFKLAEMQELMKEIIVESEAGGGLVKVSMSCAGIVKSLDINPSVISASDKETLEDMVIAAINNAGAAKEARIQEETQKMMKELGMPANAQLPV